MKFIAGILTTALLFTASAAQAGVIVGGTRLIFNGDKKESSLNINNPDHVPYLIQSWIESPAGKSEKAPFMITPPLFRLDGNQNNVLRIVRAGGSLSDTQETLYWLDIKSIPSSQKKEGQNSLLVAVKTRIKLIFRPSGVTGVPEDVTQQLKWQRNGNQLQVTNPTPFYMNFQQIDLGGKELPEPTYVAPNSSTSFAIPAGATGNSVQWKLISDFGAMGNPHKASL